MTAANRSELSLAGTWRGLDAEQRVAGIAAILLLVSTLGPFSFVEAAQVVVAAAVLVLLRKRAERRGFDLPVADGTAIAVAGGWCALLILIRLIDRPIGQSLLALVCAALLLAAGVRARTRPPRAHSRTGAPDAEPTVRLPPEAP